MSDTVLEIAGAWDRLRGAIERVETAGPFRMTADMQSLREERQRFGDLLLKLGRRDATSPPAVAEQTGEEG